MARNDQRSELGQSLLASGAQDAADNADEGNDHPPLRRIMTFTYDGADLDSSILSVAMRGQSSSFPIPDLEEDLVTDDGSIPRHSALHSPLMTPQHRVPPPPAGFIPSLRNQGSTVLQVSKVILGSGMLVLPKAFQLLGCGLGLGLLALVGLLTWFTVHGLVYAGDRTGKHTYAAVVRQACGRPAKWGLLAAVFLNCLGMCVVFLVIFGDILLGTAPEYSGVIREIFPSIPPDSPYLARWATLLVVTIAVLLPLAVQPDLSALSSVAVVGVGSVVAFAGACLVLAVAAATQGTLHPLPWLPDYDALAGGGDAAAAGGASGPGVRHAGMWLGVSGARPQAVGATAVVVGMVGVVPLLLNADICHQAIFPAMALLQPYNRKVFNGVVAAALALCNTLYALISLACLATFGDALQDNVLNNMSSAHMAPLIGAWPAALLALGVRAGYFVSLVGSFAFTLHPLRHCVLEVALGSNFPTKKMDKADRLFLPVTLALMAAIYGIAVFVPGIWVVLSLVGSCASTLMGFVFPGLVILAIMARPKATHYARRAGALLVVAIGSFMFVNGFLAVYYGNT